MSLCTDQIRLPQCVSCSNGGTHIFLQQLFDRPKISGRVGSYCVTSLRFTINKKNNGPYVKPSEPRSKVRTHPGGVVEIEEIELNSLV